MPVSKLCDIQGGPCWLFISVVCHGVMEQDFMCAYHSVSGLTWAERQLLLSRPCSSVLVTYTLWCGCHG